MSEQIKLSKKEITAAVNKWNRLLETQDTNAITALFTNAGNTFFYIKPAYAQGCTLLHHYPAVHNNMLYFLVIPKEFDNPAYAATIAKYVEACPVVENLLGDGNEIPSEVAVARINRWANNYTTWIPRQNVRPDGIFKAFTMDYSDIQLPKGRITIGLTLDPDPDRADLIVSNDYSQKTVYEDYSMPVPPYGPSALSTSFYLLSL